MKEKIKTRILQSFFKIICLAVTLTSAGCLIYHMVYLPMENKKLVDLYANETYYQEHPFAYLQTEDGIQEYRIVTVLIADREVFKTGAYIRCMC